MLTKPDFRRFRRFWPLGVVAALAGCQIIITPPDDGITRISAGEGLGAPVSVTARQGEPLRVSVSVSEAQAAANDQLFLLTEAPGEVIAEGRLRVTALRGGAPEVLSTGPAFFAAADAPTVTVASAGAEPALRVEQAPLCSGPCVAVPLEGAGTTEFELTSLQNASQNLTLYAFVAPFADAGEPANDSLSTPRLVPAPSVGASASLEGALETVGDEDFYSSELSVTQVSVSETEAPLEARFDVYTEAGELLSSGNPVGSAYTVPSNVTPQSLIARVYSEAERAAPALASSYTVEFSAVVLLSPPLEP